MSKRFFYECKLRVSVFKSKPFTWLLLPLAAGIICTSGCDGCDNKRSEGVTMNGGLLFTKEESAFLSQIRKELLPILEKIHTAEGIEAKKAAVATLVEKTKERINSPALGASQRSAIFLVVAEQLMKQGMFQSTNDKEDVEAAIFFYGHFPKQFIDHAFSKYHDFNFDKEIGERYRRAVGKIGLLNADNRSYVLDKIKSVLEERGTDTGTVQAKIYASVNAIVLEAKELLPAFEAAIKRETNENLKQVYQNAVDSIKGSK